MELVKHAPAQIWLSGRTEKGAVEKVKKACSDGKVDVKFVAMDLADFASVKRAAKVIIDGCTRLDVLMLNAGIVRLLYRWACPWLT